MLVRVAQRVKGDKKRPIKFLVTKPRAVLVVGVPKGGGEFRGDDAKRVRMGQGGGDGGRRERAAWPRPGGLPPSSLTPAPARLPPSHTT